jgi:hypothetical protein
MKREPMLGARRCLLAAAGACLLGLSQAPRARAADPAPLGEEFQVNTHTAGIQQSSSVALSASGVCVVVWQSEVDGSGDEIRAQRFDARGVAQGAEIAVNTRTAGNQNAPVVAINAAGDFVVAWQSLSAGNFESRARRFGASGEARGDEFAVSTTRGESHSAPAVAMDRAGDFVVVWRSTVDGSFEIRGRRFSAQGAARGDEIAINAVSTGDQLAPRVAADADGDFVVVWENALDDSFEIRARRFSAQGLARGSESAVHATTAGDQFAPAVALDAAGNFAVAWHSQIDGDQEIRARAFAASGQARSPEFAVNSRSSGSQKSAAVALAAGGELVVSWHSDTTGSWEIAARRFGAPPATQRSRALAPAPRRALAR